jgi:predicted XRE-type DNA-binding protein
MPVNKKEIKYIITEKGCHECISHSVNSQGYPQFMRDKKYYLIHRYVYEQKFGEITDNLFVRHKCDNTLCINPDHLELGTHKQNMRDMVERNRSAKGKNNGRGKLSDEDVLKIRQLLNTTNMTQTQIAEIFGVTQHYISYIKRGIYR